MAKARGLPPAQVALAWLLQRQAVTAPIVGATKPGHVEDAVAAIDIELAEDEVADWKRRTWRIRCWATSDGAPRVAGG